MTIGITQYNFETGVLRPWVFAFLLVGFGFSPKILAAGNEPDLFLDVVVQNRFFQLSGAAPTLDVRIRRPAFLDLLVYDMTGGLVFHKSSTSEVAVAQFAFTNLPPASRGIYSFWLVASDSNGKRLGVYPADAGGGEIIEVKNSALDRERKTISYVLPKAAAVRLRAGFQDGPYLQPIVSCVLQPAGKQEMPWDGSGQGGIYTNLYNHPSIHVNALALSLPSNMLVDSSAQTLAQPTPFVGAAVVLPPRIKDLASPPLSANSKTPKRNYWIQDDYDLVLETKFDESGDVIEVRVDCRSEDRAKLTNRRFELMLFLDGTFLMEDERSQLPFSYRAATRGLTPGRHVLTVNTIDGDGNVGTKSREFQVRKSKEGI